MDKEFFRIVIRDNTGRILHESWTLQTYAADNSDVFTNEVIALLKRSSPLNVGDSVSVQRNG